MDTMKHNRVEYVSIFEQRFTTDESERDVLHEDRYWTYFIPKEDSGFCETYDPPFDSDPGYEISMYMRMNSSDWDSNLEMFIHEKDKFFYSKTPTYNTIYLDSEKLRENINQLPHPRAIGNVNI